MKDGFFRIACAHQAVACGRLWLERSTNLQMTKKAAVQGVKLIVFPELCLTGYTCGDLFLQQILLDGALQALRTILQETADLSCICIVGLPIRYTGALYNCAAVCYQGTVLGIVPKQHLPNYGEFYEQRHFTSGMSAERHTLESGWVAACPSGRSSCLPVRRIQTLHLVWKFVKMSGQRIRHLCIWHAWEQR